MPTTTEEYAQWIKAGSHLDLLRDNALSDELIVYASGEYSFIHTVVVSGEALDPLDLDDLLNWSGNPYSAFAGFCWGGGRDDVWIDRSAAISGSKALETSRQLVYARELPERSNQERLYYEISQEYAHVTNIHLVSEHNAYCRIDSRGDLEHVVSLTTEPSPYPVSLVTFKRDRLEEYLAATESVLVQMFDFTLFKPSAFSHWPDTPEDLIHESPLFYLQKVDSKNAAYTRGVQIISIRRPRTDLFATIKGHPLPKGSPRHVEFLASDWRNRRITIVSTDPRTTTNYFEAGSNSLPFELSPAFFRPDVLLKYKSDTDKYVVDDRVIRCRDAWELRGYDVNDAGQLHAYICDLRKLPYEEQLYWKSFNEKPKAGISERAYINDFQGEPAELADPLLRIKRMLDTWKDGTVPWWTLRNAAAVARVTTPRTSSRDEWARSFSNLAKLVIEGFEVKAIRAHLREHEIQWCKKERSLALLERALSLGTDNGSGRRLPGLRKVQEIRSKADAHVGDEESDLLSRDAIREHETYTAHFDHVCHMVLNELKLIERSLASSISIE